MADHYDTLGVPRTATHDELRRAYRGLARQLHPDRHSDASPADQRRSQTRMAEVNGAWNILGDTKARDLYDLELRLGAERDARARAPRPATGATNQAYRAPRVVGRPLDGRPLDELVDIARAEGAWTTVFRAMPWLLVVGVLGGIFVFTAYAAARGSSSDAAPPTASTAQAASQLAEIGDCVRFVPNGIELDLVDCAQPNDGEIVQLVPLGRPCPVGTEQAYLPDQTQYACIRPV